MNKKIFIYLLVSFWCSVVTVVANNKFTIVIDAGHGGHDAGALGTYSKEKNINLNVALAFGRYIERNCPDVNVIYTRKTDVFVTLHERANIANRNKANLFVSIHTNALPGGKRSSGLETYTLGMHRAGDNFDIAKRENSVILIEKDYKQHYEGFDPQSSESYIMFEFMQDKNMSQSVELAKLVQTRACSYAGRQNKGVKQAGFLVLRETSMPSCLIELGFITTPTEEQYLNSSAGVDALAQGIYQAFLDYKKKHDTSITVPYKVEKEKPINIPNIVPESLKPQKSTILQELRHSRGQKMENRQEENSQKEELNQNDNSDVDTIEKTVKSTHFVNSSQNNNETISVVNATREESNSPVIRSKTRTATSVTPTTKSEKKTLARLEDNKTDKKESNDIDVPVFKVQILTSGSRLNPSSSQFKGVEDVDSYEESGIIKYTVGSSSDYNNLYRLRKQILDKFPQAFIIAFKNGEKMNVIEAIKEFKNNKKK